MLIDLYPVDLLREPRLGPAMKPYREETDDGEVGFLWSAPCQFLDGERRCSIYPTRPIVCVVFEAGGEECQRVREEAELPPLQPVSTSVDQTEEP
jgi:Fe-S-cluster containining protein